MMFFLSLPLIPHQKQRHKPQGIGFASEESALRTLEKYFFLCLFGESCSPLLLLFLFLPASPNQFRQWGIIPAWKGGGRERTRMGLISLPPSLLLSVAEGRQEGCVYQTNSGSLLLPPAYSQAPSHPRNGGTRKRKTGAASSFA